MDRNRRLFLSSLPLALPVATAAVSGLVAVAKPTTADASGLGGLIAVQGLATGGNGTISSPYTGWETQINSSGTYYFTPEYYAYSAAPNWGIPGLSLLGNGATILHTGTGNAFVMDGVSNYVNEIYVENLIVQGNSNSTNGIYHNLLSRCIFNNLRCPGCSPTGAGLVVYGCVLNSYSDFKCSNNIAPFVSQPANGIVIDGKGGTSSNYSTQNCFINPMIEVVSATGIVFNHANQNLVTGGASEANATGTNISSTANSNILFNVDFEANTSGTDISVNGTCNHLVGVDSASTTVVAGSSNLLMGGSYGTDINVSGNFNQLIGVDILRGTTVVAGSTNLLMGGSYSSISITNSAVRTSLSDVIYGFAIGSISGTLSDASTTSIYRNLTNLAGISPTDKVFSTLEATGVILTAAAIPNDDGLNLGRTTSGSASAGANGAPPLTVAGYLVAYNGTTEIKIPYYNA